MLERIELLQDIQTSVGQIEAGQGIDHNDAKETVLKRIGR
jgi:antitoxin YefM